MGNKLFHERRHRGTKRIQKRGRTKLTHQISNEGMRQPWRKEGQVPGAVGIRSKGNAGGQNNTWTRAS